MIFMRVLVVDVGGNHVKFLVTGQEAPREFASGPSMTAEEMVSGLLKAAEGWKYDVVSIGSPGAVLRDKPVSEPHNLGPGWVGFDFEAAFGCPVKLINDAAMQALGSYEGGKMLFLGLGTGPSSVPERHLRGLRGRSRIGTAGDEEMAKTRRGRGRLFNRRPPTQ